MTKPDIRAEDALQWDEFKDKTLDEALPSIYQRACTACETFPGWYWRSIRTKRRTSLVVRLLTFAMVIAGTLAPLLAGLYGTPNERLTLTQLGVCALALGGLLQIADRVFGWSSGWLRYIRTATAMEGRARQFQLDWSGYIIGKGGRLADTDVKPLFDMAADLQKGLMTLQSGGDRRVGHGVQHRLQPARRPDQVAA